MAQKQSLASSKCCDQTHEEDSGVSGDSQIDSPKNKTTTPCKFLNFHVFEDFCLKLTKIQGAPHQTENTGFGL